MAPVRVANPPKAQAGSKAQASSEPRVDPRYEKKVTVKQLLTAFFATAALAGAVAIVVAFAQEGMIAKVSEILEKVNGYYLDFGAVAKAKILSVAKDMFSKTAE
eukprot:TRINITY_DN29637_c0_g1_i1.p1 TRINITY_DN29637_c0_g1~~TRINITY_DN29637_c0_g1_i1.p1  ORF type:complete len:104 (+),score=24.56 TRINITY_DN29637_c0_g1_i1:72-383(+)